MSTPDQSVREDDSSLTPFRRQYLQLKRRFNDAILLFRMGDFYETFDDDARILSAELDIVLTGRDIGKGGNRIPMAGVPHHSLDSHLAKLVKRGYRIAVCEQLTDPKTSKGLVERDVTRIVTPGTVIEPSMLDEKRNNFLVAVVPHLNRGHSGSEPSYGLAYVDVSTGEFAATEIRRDESGVLLREIERLAPVELLVPNEWGELQFFPEPPRDTRVSRLDDWKTDLTVTREALCHHFDVASLEGYGCEHLPLATRAAGAIVQYLGETRKVALGQLVELRIYQTGAYMLLDTATRRNLELSETSRSGSVRGSLVWVLDRTKTSNGGRLLRAWLNQPLLDLASLRERLDTVTEFVADASGRARLRDLLGRVRDLERLINRIGQGAATPRDLLALRASLSAIPQVVDALATGDREPAERRQEIARGLDECAEIVELVEAAIVEDPPTTLSDGGVIKAGFSSDLDDLRNSTEHARLWIENLETSERERTGIRGLRVGYNRVFGYYLEISNANRDLVPETYIRKQTLVNAERYVTPELKEYEAIVLNAKERIVETELALFRQTCAQIAAERGRVLRTAQAIARADVLASLAEVAVQNNFVRPELDEGPELRITGGRHPVVEETRRDVPFTPNDVALSTEDAQIILLTGPNMAGKSTFLRQVALIVLLAQIGSYVPADSARIGLVDRIFTRVGAQDDLNAGQSTFLVEMLETANLLTQSTRRSLLILDEVGRGTSTYDGLAIAQAIVEYIHNHPRLGARTLFATHYHELTDLANVLPRTRNFRMDVREEDGEVHFLHRVVPGAADRSYGIHVGRLAGLPRAVTRRAEEILRDLEKKGVRTTRKREPEIEVIQLSWLGEPNPALEELKALDVLAITPIEAVAKLFELQTKARDGS